VKLSNDTVQWTVWNATPEHTETLKEYDCPIIIKRTLKTKEDSAENGTDCGHLKAKHYLIQALKQLLYNNKNIGIQTFLQGVTQTESTHHSLWKANKRLKEVKEIPHYFCQHKQLG
jgi:hypothetical protein